MEQYEQCKSTNFQLVNALGFGVNSDHCFIQTSVRKEQF